jgi:hypothetical protein
MKQSHTMRCEVVPFVISLSYGGSSDRIKNKLSNAIQERLDKGWTLRAAPSDNGVTYLVFVRKEAKQSP